MGASNTVNTPFFGRTSIDLKAAGGSPPHIFSGPSARVLQWQKVFSLFPLILAGLFCHGWAACHVLGVSLCGALLAEAAGGLLSRRMPAYQDGETVFYGLLLGVLLPFSIPTGIIFLTVFTAVFLGREIFGGFGQAPFFPPALGRLLLYFGTPALIQAFDFKQAQSLTNTLMFVAGSARPILFFFYRDGTSLEDVSWAALFLGGLFLIAKGSLRWQEPVFYLAVLAVLEAAVKKNPPAYLVSGGLLIAAFYGMGHSAGLPLTRRARMIFAALAALLAALMPAHDITIRALAGILALNVLSPWLDALFRPRALRVVHRGQVLNADLSPME